MMTTVTGYDLHMLLKYRNSIQNKETEIKFNVTRTKEIGDVCTQASEYYGTPRISQIFHGEII